MNSPYSESSIALPAYERGSRATSSGAYRYSNHDYDLERQEHSDETYPLTAYPPQQNTTRGPSYHFEGETGYSGCLQPLVKK